MGNFLLNIGNTHSQFSSESLELVESVNSKEILNFLKSSLNQEDNLYVASVVKELEADIQGLPVNSRFLAWEDLVINFSKVDPTTIGADRLANIAAVTEKGRDCLVLDCGTCVTGEMVSYREGFVGGFIAPGRQLSRQVLHEHTSQLPEIDFTDNYSLLGKNTEEAIQVGIDTLSGMSIEKYCHEILKIYEDLEIVFTGGDAEFYAKFISLKYSVDPLLTLKGIRSVFINRI